MTQPQQAFFTATDLDSLSVTTALVEGDVLSIAKDDHSLSLPISTAADIAAETIRLLLEEDDITNGHGLSLSEWLAPRTLRRCGASCPRSPGRKARHSQRRTVKPSNHGVACYLGSSDVTLDRQDRSLARPIATDLAAVETVFRHVRVAAR
jgi:hypothetical protein